MYDVSLYNTEKTRRIREQLYEEQEGMCYYCLADCYPPEKASYINEERDLYFVIDHKIPMSRGGANMLSNVVGACWACNARKGAMTDVEFQRVVFEKV